MEENVTTNSNQDLVKHAVRLGAIIGGLGIVITLLFYAIDYTLLADWKFGVFMIVFSIGFIIYAGINYRTQIGGFIPYGKAFLHGYITLAVGGIISIIFTMILYNVIDTELPQKLTDVSIEKTAEMMRSFGAPEDKTEEALDKMRVDMPARFSVVGQLKSYLWALLIYAVISSLTSLAVKKNKPEEM